MLAPPRGTEALDPVQRRAVRAALQVVYHHSVGQLFVSETAPAMLLPAASQMSLADALKVLSGSVPRMREAIWTIARSVPPAPLATSDAGAGVDRYPDVLLAALSDHELHQLATFELIRGDYCREAELLSGAIIAFAPLEDCWTRFQRVQDQYVAPLRPGGIDHGLQQVLGAVNGVGDPGLFTVAGYLEQVLDKSGAPERCEPELRRFELEVGMPLPAFLRQFVDSVAFQIAFQEDHGPQVFPAVSIAVQDADSLLTRVTVTSLVAGQTYENLALGIDPQRWVDGSDAFLESTYVTGPLDLDAIAPPPGGDPGPAPRFLEEVVVFLWGEGEEVGGSSHNVLRFDQLDFHKPRPKRGSEPAFPGSIDVRYDLARSVESRLLWDVRPGGLLVDCGYLKAHGVCDVHNLWRVTIQKVLLWSDREPYAIGGAIGNTLNYLAPATVSWWQESEMYSYSVVPGES